LPHFVISVCCLSVSLSNDNKAAGFEFNSTYTSYKAETIDFQLTVLRALGRFTHKFGYLKSY